MTYIGSGICEGKALEKHQPNVCTNVQLLPYDLLLQSLHVNGSGYYLKVVCKKLSPIVYNYFVSFTYSKMSPGWQFSTSQIVSNVLKRMAFAFPVFRMERLDSVKPTFSESSFSDIFRFAIITSKFTIIGISYMVKSFSF